MITCWQQFVSWTPRVSNSIARLATGVVILGALADGPGFPQELNTPAATTGADSQPADRLLPIPVVKIDSQRYLASPDENRQIEALIDRIREIETPDFGFAPFMSGDQFAPIEGSGKFGGGILMQHNLKTSKAVAELVALGPKALPKLLERLTDETPSRLVMQGVSAQWYAREIPMSDAHPTESRVRKELSEILSPPKRKGAKRASFVARHKITTGDVCFVIVGQIVNRSYEAARYQPTNCRVINSPTHDPKIAEVIRALWQSDDPARMLLDSLLIDFHTRDESGLQAGAAMRLLYYFPEQSADLISKRIMSIDLTELRSDPETLLMHVKMAKHPKVVAALTHVIKNAASPQIVLAALGPAVVKQEPEIIFQRMREFIVDRPAEDDDAADVLEAAVKLFPQRSKELFDKYRGTTESRIYALASPTRSEPWMVEYLASLLDDKTETIDGYGPEWDYHQVRVCDLAAKVLADFHLKPPVRFEFEENPAFLNMQIAKLRRVLAGEKDVSFELPPELVMPKDLPTRQARKVLDLPADYGHVYALSDEREIWIGDGFQGRGGWAYDTLRIELGSGKVVERTPLDQWEGGVSLLDNGKLDLAYCYHGYEGGHVTVRDLKSGRVVKQVATPFHDGVAFHDPLQIRDLGDITMCGKEGRWIMAITPDFALHSIDTESDEHRIEWKYKIPKGEDPVGSGEVLGLHGNSKVLLEGVGGDGLFDAPLRIWNQSTRTMTVADKLPKVSWQGGWGDLAWNNWCGIVSLWNIQTLKPIRLPRSDEAVASIICDSDQSTMFVLRGGGSIDVFRVMDGDKVKPIARLSSPTTEATDSVHVVASNDDRFLFWQGSPRKVNADGDPVESNRLIIAQFDIADLTE